MQDELQKMARSATAWGFYEDARYALQQAGGDMATAMVIAEQDRETAGGGLPPPAWRSWMSCKSSSLKARCGRSA